MGIGQKRLELYGLRHLDTLPELQRLSSQERFDIEVVGQILPFRVNN